MTVCQKNLYYAQELQKWTNNKSVKPRSYAPSDKIWINSKYITIKQNQKFEAKIFGLFEILYSVGKQAYKLELPKRWKIHNVFHVSLLEQKTIRQGQVGKKVIKLEFEVNNSEKYKVEAIWDSTVYANKVKVHLPGLNYLIA